MTYFILAFGIIGLAVCIVNSISVYLIRLLTYSKSNKYLVNTLYPVVLTLYVALKILFTEALGLIGIFIVTWLIAEGFKSQFIKDYMEVPTVITYLILVYVEIRSHIKTK